MYKSIHYYFFFLFLVSTLLCVSVFAESPVSNTYESVKNYKNQLLQKIAPLKQSLDKKMIFYKDEYIKRASKINEIRNDQNIEYQKLQVEIQNIEKEKVNYLNNQFHQLNKLYNEYYSLWSYLKKSRSLKGRDFTSNLILYKNKINKENNELDGLYKNLIEEQQEEAKQAYWDYIKGIVEDISLESGVDISDRVLGDPIAPVRFFPVISEEELLDREKYQTWDFKKIQILTSTNSFAEAAAEDTRTGDYSPYTFNLIKALSKGDITTLFDAHQSAKGVLIEHPTFTKQLPKEALESFKVSDSFDKKIKKTRCVLILGGHIKEEVVPKIKNNIELVLASVKKIYGLPSQNIKMLASNKLASYGEPTLVNIVSALKGLDSIAASSRAKNPKEKPELLVYLNAEGRKAFNSLQFTDDEDDNLEGKFLGAVVLADNLVEFDPNQAFITVNGYYVQDGLPELTLKTIFQKYTPNFSSVSIVFESCFAGNFLKRTTE